MHRTLAPLCLSLALLAPAALAAQPRVLSLTDSSGTPMEVVGLRRWTVAMIEDSIAKYAPGESMRSHACQAVLQYKLGFPSASVVQYYMSAPDGKESSALVVTVVEPQDSGRLSWRRVTAPAKPRLAQWADLYAPVSARWDTTKPPEVAQAYLSGVMQDIARARTQPQDMQAMQSGAPPALRDSLAAFTQRLGRRTTDADLALARATIHDDGNVENRMIAVAVLSNFPERAEAWHALLDALLDRDELVRGPAEAALASMPRGRSLTVDWAPVVPQLRAVLAGTGVGAISTVLRVLRETGISPALATTLLVGNADYVLAQASITPPWGSQGARQFLALASGRKDATVAEWEEWLRGEEAKAKRGG